MKTFVELEMKSIINRLNMYSFRFNYVKICKSFLSKYSYLYKYLSVDVALYTFIILGIFWLHIAVKLSLEFIILITGFVLAAFKIKERHSELFLQCKITQTEQFNNTVIELVSLLFAIILAGILGEFISAKMSTFIISDLSRTVFGVGTGVTVGLCIGLLFKRISNHLVKS